MADAAHNNLTQDPRGYLKAMTEGAVDIRLLDDHDDVLMISRGTHCPNEWRQISTRHCLVWFDTEEDALSVRAMGAHGTWVNDKYLTCGVRLQMEHGGLLKLGPDGENPVVVWQYLRPNPPPKRRPGAPFGAFEDYHLTKRLGSGTFGEVFCARRDGTNDIYALKVIKHQPGDEEIFVAFEREVRSIDAIRHKNIVEIRDVMFEPGQGIAIALEYVSGGDLLAWVLNRQDTLENRPQAAEHHARYFIQQVLEGIEACHTLGIAHRDLKLENILLTSEEPPRVKIADFGFAKFFDEGRKELKSFSGTDVYMAPEVANPPYTEKVDCWSIGVTLYALVTCRFPFSASSTTRVPDRDNIRGRVFDPSNLREKGYSPGLIDLLCGLLSTRPTERLSVREALYHPWIAWHDCSHYDVNQIPAYAGVDRGLVEDYDMSSASATFSYNSVDPFSYTQARAINDWRTEARDPTMLYSREVIPDSLAVMSLDSH